MTIDERLEKLVERHEALTRSVELLLTAQQENEKLFIKLREENEKRHLKTQQENEKRHAWVLDTLVRVEGNILDHDTQIATTNQQIAKLSETVDRYIRARGNGQDGG